MRKRPVAFAVSTAIAGLLCLVAVAAPPGAARADELDELSPVDEDAAAAAVENPDPQQREASDRKAWDALRQQHAALEKSAPAQAVKTYEAFLNSRPLAPMIDIEATTHTASLLYNTLKDKDSRSRAHRLWDAAIRQHRDFPASGDLLASKAWALLGENKPEEALTLLRANYPQLRRNWQHAAVPALHAYSQALARQKQPQAQVALIKQTLLNWPWLLGGPIQAYDWLYNDLQEALLKLKRNEEALSWAKLRWMTTPYEAEAISRASRYLTGVWSAVEPQKKGLQGFAAAQKDPAKPNPLAQVPLPVLSQAEQKALGEWLQSHAVEREAAGRINALLLLGQTRQAAQEASKLWLGKMEDVEHVKLVMRVLKAHDLNLKSANAFLKFAKTNQGTNPLNALLKG